MYSSRYYECRLIDSLTQGNQAMSIQVRRNTIAFFTNCFNNYPTADVRRGFGYVRKSPYAVFVTLDDGFTVCVGLYSRLRDAVKHYFSRHFRLNHLECWIDDIRTATCIGSILHNGIRE